MSANPNDIYTFAVTNPDPFTVTFANGAKMLFWKDGRVTFEGGDPDEAAQVFYDHLIKHHFNYVHAKNEKTP